MNLPTPQGFDLVVALKERESGRLHSLDATTDNLHTESMPVEHRHETLLSFVRAYQSAVADTNPLPVQHNTRLAFRVDHSPVVVSTTEFTTCPKKSCVNLSMVVKTSKSP